MPAEEAAQAFPVDQLLTALLIISTIGLLIAAILYRRTTTQTAVEPTQTLSQEEMAPPQMERGIIQLGLGWQTAMQFNVGLIVVLYTIGMIVFMYLSVAVIIKAMAEGEAFQIFSYTALILAIIYIGSLYVDAKLTGGKNFMAIQHETMTGVELQGYLPVARIVSISVRDLIANIEMMRRNLARPKGQQS